MNTDVAAADEREPIDKRITRLRHYVDASMREKLIAPMAIDLREVLKAYEQLKTQLAEANAKLAAAEKESARKGFLRGVAELREQARRRRATAYELSGEDRTIPTEVARELEHLADWLERSTDHLLAALGATR
jgi:hypothetical protein